MLQNLSAYVKSAWQFELRDTVISPPANGEILVEVAACGVCGTDLHISDRTAKDWQPFGHEVSGIVRKVGENVIRFKEGDRVALDSSAPCGKCAHCLPKPYGRSRPDLCLNSMSFGKNGSKGFGQFVVGPQECAVPVPAGMSLETACLTEPIGVSLDLVETAEIRPGDRVLIIGPGPLGLGAAAIAKRYGAAWVGIAGRSSSIARMQAGLALGADALFEIDKTPLKEIDFGDLRPDKILVTAPPAVLVEAIHIVARGGVIAYIGIAFGPESRIEIDADDFHFRKLSLRGSHASPATHAQESIDLLREMPILAQQIISHRFDLKDIAESMLQARDDRQTVKKMVMVNSIG